MPKINYKKAPYYPEHHPTVVFIDGVAIGLSDGMEANQAVRIAKLIANAPKMAIVLERILRTGYHDTVAGEEAIKILHEIGVEL